MQSDIGPTMEIARGVFIESNIEYPFWLNQKFDCRTILFKIFCSTIDFYDLILDIGILINNSRNLNQGKA